MSSAVKIDVTIPAMLAVSIGERTIAVEAGTVAAALSQLAAHPKLGPLIFDEAGELRRHVLVFYNETSTRHLPTLDVPLKQGDRIDVVQAVSGGR